MQKQASFVKSPSHSPSGSTRKTSIEKELLALLAEGEVDLETANAEGDHLPVDDEAEKLLQRLATAGNDRDAQLASAELVAFVKKESFHSVALVDILDENSHLSEGFCLAAQQYKGIHGDISTVIYHIGAQEDITHALRMALAIDGNLYRFAEFSHRGMLNSVLVIIGDDQKVMTAAVEHGMLKLLIGSLDRGAVLYSPANFGAVCVAIARVLELCAPAVLKEYGSTLLFQDDALVESVVDYCVNHPSGDTVQPMMVGVGAILYQLALREPLHVNGRLIHALMLCVQFGASGASKCLGQLMRSDFNTTATFVADASPLLPLVEQLAGKGVPLSVLEMFFEILPYETYATRSTNATDYLGEATVLSIVEAMVVYTKHTLPATTPNSEYFHLIVQTLQKLIGLSIGAAHFIKHAPDSVITGVVSKAAAADARETQLGGLFIAVVLSAVQGGEERMTHLGLHTTVDAVVRKGDATQEEGLLLLGEVPSFAALTQDKNAAVRIQAMWRGVAARVRFKAVLHDARFGYASRHEFERGCMAARDDIVHAEYAERSEIRLTMEEQWFSVVDGVDKRLATTRAIETELDEREHLERGALKAKSATLIATATATAEAKVHALETDAEKRKGVLQAQIRQAQHRNDDELATLKQAELQRLDDDTKAAVHAEYAALKAQTASLEAQQHTALADLDRQLRRQRGCSLLEVEEEYYRGDGRWGRRWWMGRGVVAEAQQAWAALQLAIRPAILPLNEAALRENIVQAAADEFSALFQKCFEATHVQQRSSVLCSAQLQLCNTAEESLRAVAQCVSDCTLGSLTRTFYVQFHASQRTVLEASASSARTTIVADAAAARDAIQSQFDAEHEKLVKHGAFAAVQHREDHARLQLREAEEDALSAMRGLFFQDFGRVLRTALFAKEIAARLALEVEQENHFFANIETAAAAAFAEELQRKKWRSIEATEATRRQRLVAGEEADFDGIRQYFTEAVASMFSVLGESSETMSRNILANEEEVFFAELLKLQRTTALRIAEAETRDAIDQESAPFWSALGDLYAHAVLEQRLLAIEAAERSARPSVHTAQAAAWAALVEAHEREAADALNAARMTQCQLDEVSRRSAAYTEEAHAARKLLKAAARLRFLHDSINLLDAEDEAREDLDELAVCTLATACEEGARHILAHAQAAAFTAIAVAHADGLQRALFSRTERFESSSRYETVVEESMLWKALTAAAATSLQRVRDRQALQTLVDEEGVQRQTIHNDMLAGFHSVTAEAAETFGIALRTLQLRSQKELLGDESVGRQYHAASEANAFPSMAATFLCQAYGIIGHDAAAEAYAAAKTAFVATLVDMQSDARAAALVAAETAHDTAATDFLGQHSELIADYTAAVREALRAEAGVRLFGLAVAFHSRMKLGRTLHQNTQLRLERCAVLVQQMARYTVSTRHAVNTVHERFAINLQRVFRGGTVRFFVLPYLRTTTRDTSAIRIQSAFRGFSGRLRAGYLRQERHAKVTRELHKQSDAALALQWGFRDLVVKKKAKQQVQNDRLSRVKGAAAITIQCQARKLIARARARVASVDLARRRILKLQRCCRGGLARMHSLATMYQRKQAGKRALVVQQFARAFIARCAGYVRRGTPAAKVIQRLVRCHFAYWAAQRLIGKKKSTHSHLEMHYTATDIQKVVRGFLARKKHRAPLEEKLAAKSEALAQQRRDAAAVVGGVAAAYAERRALYRLREQHRTAAAKMQRCARGFLAVRELNRRRVVRRQLEMFRGKVATVQQVQLFVAARLAMGVVNARWAAVASRHNATVGTAVALQRVGRGFLARTTIQLRADVSRCAVHVIQRAWRSAAAKQTRRDLEVARDGRRAAFAQMRMCIVIQQAARKWLARRSGAAYAIQSCFMQRREILHLNSLAKSEAASLQGVETRQVIREESAARLHIFSDESAEWGHILRQILPFVVQKRSTKYMPLPEHVAMALDNEEQHGRQQIEIDAVNWLRGCVISEHNDRTRIKSGVDSEQAIVALQLNRTEASESVVRQRVLRDQLKQRRDISIEKLKLLRTQFRLQTVALKDDEESKRGLLEKTSSDVLRSLFAAFRSVPTPTPTPSPQKADKAAAHVTTSIHPMRVVPPSTFMKGPQVLRPLLQKPVAQVMGLRIEGTTLDVSGKGLSEDHTPEICSVLDGATGVTCVLMGGNNLSDGAFLTVLQALRKHSQTLVTLDVSHNQMLTDLAAMNLARVVPHFTHLATISLFGTSISIAKRHLLHGQLAAKAAPPTPPHAASAAGAGTPTTPQLPPMPRYTRKLLFPPRRDVYKK